MTRNTCGREASTLVSRRMLIKALGTVAGAAAVAPRLALAQGPAVPPSTVTTPPRDFGPTGAPTTYFTDPDIITVDPSFNGLVQPNSAITRLWTGALWSEGRRGAGRGAISSGATSRTTGSSGGSRTTAA